MNRYQSTIDKQREFFLTDATKSYTWRMDQLDRMERMLRENQDAFCAALYQDFGKPSFEQLFEITVPLGNVKYYRENLGVLMAPQRLCCTNPAPRTVTLPLNSVSHNRATNWLA